MPSRERGRRSQHSKVTWAKPTLRLSERKTKYILPFHPPASLSHAVQEMDLVIFLILLILLPRHELTLVGDVSLLTVLVEHDEVINE